MCIFHQSTYIRLLKLLLMSISTRSHIDANTTHILIYTSLEFQSIIQDEIKDLSIHVMYEILDLSTLMESSCCKTRIFTYGTIHMYEKILYLDTDILINSDINILFNIPIESNVIYALEEGNLGDAFWGGQFFDNIDQRKSTTAFSAGVLYFMNSPSMRTLFDDITKHIDTYMKNTDLPPTCLDQPFVVYHAVLQNKYNNQLLKSYVELNPKEVSSTIIIYHFAGEPGDYLCKYKHMFSFWNKMRSDSSI